MVYTITTESLEPVSNFCASDGFKVCTVDGYKAVESLQVGDVLLGVKGSPCKIVNIIPIEPGKEIK
jgi:hypothetical protein